MKKKHPFNKKFIFTFVILLSFPYLFLAQCPSDIEISNDQDQCSAMVIFGMPPSYANLMQNGDASENLDGWGIGASGGSGWAVNAGAFVTSYGNCEKHQEIILSEVGYTDEDMDAVPDIYIAEDYQGISTNASDTYYLTVELRDETGAVIDSYSTGNLTTTAEWQTAGHVFSNYGQGVRSVYFSHGGRDAEGWSGNYGSAMTNAQVSIGGPVNTVQQTEGLASGEAFPIGETINTFEIISSYAGTQTCSFKVTVTDDQSPEIRATDISLHMTEDLEVVLTSEMLDTGSFDNCGVESYSIDVASLGCNEIGDNEVNLTVTDISGNTSTETFIVHYTDPNNYCQLSVQEKEFKAELTLYPNPTQGVFNVSSKSTIESIALYDVNGKMVNRFEVNSTNYQADISNLATGVYFVKISNGINTIRKQLIKN